MAISNMAEKSNSLLRLNVPQKERHWSPYIGGKAKFAGSGLCSILRDHGHMAVKASVLGGAGVGLEMQGAGVDLAERLHWT